MARLVLQLVGLLLVAAAGFGAAAEEAETTQPAGGLLRVRSWRWVWLGWRANSGRASGRAGD